MTAGRAMLLAVGVALVVVLYAALRPFVDRTACRSSAAAPSPELARLIASHSEARAKAEAASRGLTTTGSWADWQSRYDILQDREAQAILIDPSRHLGEAVRVMNDAQFDETQKMIAVLLMQRLPVGQYICFMDSVNDAIDKGALKDKRIAAQALMPDATLRSSSSNYWWHPLWRQAFQRHASRVLNEEQIDRVLSGRHWFGSL